MTMTTDEARAYVDISLHLPATLHAELDRVAVAGGVTVQALIITAMADRLGVPVSPRRRGRPQTAMLDMAAIAADYASGMAINAIAKKHGVDWATAKKRIVEIQEATAKPISGGKN